MSEKSDNRWDDRNDFPEWQRELKEDPNEESRELQATQNEKEDRSARFEPFPDDERREREQRRLNPDRDDFE